MASSDHDTARGLFLAALRAHGVTFASADVERLIVEFEDHVRDGRLLAHATPSETEPAPSVRLEW